MRSWEAYSEAPAGTWRTTIGIIAGADNVLLQQADLSLITLRVWRSSGLERDAELLYQANVPIGTTVFDVPQTDSWWDAALSGGDGYNFRHTLKVGDPATPGADQIILTGGETYELEYEFATLSKGPIFVVHHARVEPILSR